MSRGTWTRIRQSNRFYVDTYHQAITGLIVSVALSIVLVLAISYHCVSRPEHDFYASSGIEPPVALTPMAHPNATAVPLLEDEPNQNGSTRVVPN